MKILLCTNAFENVTNGPAKFAHLLLGLPSQTTAVELRVLTEDAISSSDQVYRLVLRIPRWLKPIGMFLRMFQYHKRAIQIRKNDYPFDILIYNNAIVSLWSALWLKNVIGFINDDNHVDASWRNALLKFKWKRAHLFYLTEWLACKWCHKIVANSDYLQSQLLNTYQCDPKKIFRLYKAVEIEVEIKVRNNKIPIVLFIKNDYKRGGLHILINALNDLNAKVKLIIGGTPPEHDKEICKFFTNPIVDYELKGFLTQNEVYDLMRHADIFCVPSVKEAFGVANVEAMRLGCAVISTTAGGIPEAMDNGRCGWMVKPGNSSALSVAIKECLSDDDLRIQKIKYAADYSCKFTTESMFQKLIEIVNT